MPSPHSDADSLSLPFALSPPSPHSFHGAPLPNKPGDYFVHRTIVCSIYIYAKIVMCISAYAMILK